MAKGRQAHLAVGVLRAKALVAAGASKKLQNLADDARGKLEKGVGGLLNKLKKKKDN